MKLSRNGRLLKKRAGLYNICAEILHPKEDYDMSKLWKKVLAASVAGTRMRRGMTGHFPRIIFHLNIPATAMATSGVRLSMSGMRAEYSAWTLDLKIS